MRPLFPLAAFLIAFSPAARAQSRVGAVEAGVELPGSQNGAMTPGLSVSGAPQLVTLNLAAPTLALTPNLAPAPSALTPASLTPSPLRPSAVPYAAEPLALLPESSVSPAQMSVRKLSTVRPAEAALSETKAGLPQTPAAGDLSLSALIDTTKRLFGESSRPGFKSSQYLRLAEPFEFGASEVFRYRTALNAYGAKDGGEATETLLSAAEGLAASAGIKTERGERSLPDGTVRPVLKILPQLKGHRLNKLAWDLGRGFGAGVEYSPERTRGGHAAFNGLDNVLFLPDFGKDEAFEAVLHESRHAAFAKRLRNGDISAFHGALVAYAGRDIAPGAMSYDKYMSFEELSTHVKTLLHAILRAQSADGVPARDAAVADAKTYAFQFVDVLRSAEINLYQLSRMLEKGPVTGAPVVGSQTFRDFKGGHWEMISLPHAMFVVPVLDEAPARKPNLWDRMFKAPPETAAAKAARRHVSALRPLIQAAGDELETYLGALKGGEPDLRKARASASRMTSLAAKADEAFSASR